MTTDLNHPNKGIDHSINKYQHINVNGSNDSNSPTTYPKNGPGKVQGVDEKNQPEVEPGKMLEDEKFTEK
jgi:hypothetical protein